MLSSHLLNTTKHVPGQWRDLSGEREKADKVDLGAGCYARRLSISKPVALGGPAVVQLCSTTTTTTSWMGPLDPQALAGCTLWRPPA
jgi:hypothetical protein